MCAGERPHVPVALKLFIKVRLTNVIVILIYNNFIWKFNK